MSQKFPKSARLRTSADFDRVYRGDVYAADQVLVIRAAAYAGQGEQTSGGRPQTSGLRPQARGGRAQAPGGREQTSGLRAQAADDRAQARGDRAQAPGGREQTSGLRAQAADDRAQAADDRAQEGIGGAGGRLEKTAQPSIRLGLSVSKKVGNAVVRNRWKRLIREAFRLERGQLPHGLDLVVRPRKGAQPDLEAIRQSLRQLTRRVSQRLVKGHVSGSKKQRGPSRRGSR